MKDKRSSDKKIYLKVYTICTTQKGVDPSKDTSPMIDIKCELKLTNMLSLCFVHLVVVISVYGGWTLADLMKMSMALTREETYRVVPPATILDNGLLNKKFGDENLVPDITEVLRWCDLLLRVSIVCRKESTVKRIYPLSADHDCECTIEETSKEGNNKSNGQLFQQAPCDKQAMKQSSKEKSLTASRFFNIRPMTGEVLSETLDATK
ncbi:hypothetical protein CBL_00880 [Carabus blaptoides fortunei]